MKSYESPLVVDYGDVLDLTEATCNHAYLDNNYLTGTALCSNPTLGIGITTGTQHGSGGLG